MVRRRARSTSSTDRRGLHALDGIETMFLLFPLPSNRAAQQAVIPFVHAAERFGCRHVVYVSVFGADRARFIPHYKVEAALQASSMSVTILRCSFFMQNLHRVISTHRHRHRRQRRRPDTSIIAPAGRAALRNGSRTRPASPVLEVETLLRVLFADQGSVDHLRARQRPPLAGSRGGLASVILGDELLYPVDRFPIGFIRPACGCAFDGEFAAAADHAGVTRPWTKSTPGRTTKDPA